MTKTLSETLLTGFFFFVILSICDQMHMLGTIFATIFITCDQNTEHYEPTDI